MMAMKSNPLRKLLKAANTNKRGRNATGKGQGARGMEHGGKEQEGMEQGAWSMEHGEKDQAGKGQEGKEHGAWSKEQGGKSKGNKPGHGYFRGLLSGTFISESLILKDIRYSVLVAMLAVIFIANRFNAESVEREIIVLEQEVRDMRSESLSVSAELGSVSRQSEITELVKARGLGLQELREPPFRIVVHE